MTSEWTPMAIGEVLKLEYGKPLDSADRGQGDYLVYGANGPKDRTNRFLVDRAGIVVGRKGSVGEINLTDGPFWPLDVTYFVSFDDGRHDLRFIYYLLTTLGLPKLAKGVKPGLNRNEVYGIRALVPVLSEQQRIVCVLDEAFAAVATAKANTEKSSLLSQV